MTGPVAWRAPLLALGAVALLAGLVGALSLLGIVPAMGRTADAHGLVMPLGFLGTLISLERAVALRAPVAFTVPLAAGVGALALLTGLPRVVGAFLLTAAGVGLVLVYLAIGRRQPALYVAVQAGGAVCWYLAGLVVLHERPVADAVPLLGAFLVITITGERLELSRVGLPPRPAQLLFATTTAAVVAGAALLAVVAPYAAGRAFGVGLLAVAVWLLRYDVARRTLRIPGLPRFVAGGLLAGYAWLALAGLAWVFFGVPPGGFWDAALHALFLGFVMGMVFAHAPVILPAVLRVSLPYRPVLVVPVLLLHVSLALRVVGDVAGAGTAWRIGGILNVAAVLLFIATAALVALSPAPVRAASPTAPRPGVRA